MSIEVGILISIISVVVAILGFQLNRATYQMKQQQSDKSEVKEESKQDAKMQAQLEYISKGVDDIRIDLKANEKQMIALGERVTRVEESAKQAHKRIDNISPE